MVPSMRRVLLFALLLQAVGAQTSSFNLSTFGQLVSDCGTGWGCYREGCASGSSYLCSYVAMYRDYNGMFEFVLSTKGNDYAALGFSVDQSMGDDEVLACVRYDVGNVTADHYVNPGSHTGSMESLAQLLGLIGSFDENGQIGCRFTRPHQTSNIVDQIGYYDLMRPYYQLYAYGPVQDGFIAFHAPVPYPSASANAISIATDRTVASDARRTAPVVTLIVAFLMALAL